MYKIELEPKEPIQITIALMRRLKPTSNWDVLYPRMVSVASHMQSGKMVVYDDKAPIFRCEVEDGRITMKTYVGSPYIERPYYTPDKKQKAMHDADLAYATKSRRNNQVIGFRKGDITNWIAKEGSGIDLSQCTSTQVKQPVTDSMFRKEKRVLSNEKFILNRYPKS